MLKDYNTSYKESTNQILIVDKNGLVIDCDSQLFENSKGKKLNNLHPFFISITNLLNTPNKTYNFECINLKLNNLNHSVDLTLHTNKKNENAVIVIQNLTTQYIRYQKVAQNRNEAEIKSQVLDFNNKLLLEKEAFKDNFIANFSHQIKLPLISIDGFVTQLEESNLEQNQRYNLKIIKSTNGRLKTMINDILDISKIEANHFKAYKIRYNLIQELNILAEIYSKKCEEKGLKFVINIDKNCPKYVIADKFRLAQIASNLIGNAIKFTTNGNVTIDVKTIKQNKNKATILFTITDTGIGIEKNHLENIYKSFYQINNNINNDGSGLGLAITKNLIKALNGTINIKSKPEIGTTAKVTLDFKIADNQENEKSKTNIKNTATSNAPKILIAEPLQKEQDLLVKHLTAKQLFNVDVVETGDAVIEALHSKIYDTVILNIKLPTMDGLDTARYIRHSDFSHFNNIPIIIISSKPSTQEEQYCKNKKINSYIGRPYNKAELLRKVKYNVKKKQAQ